MIHASLRPVVGALAAVFVVCAAAPALAQSDVRERITRIEAELGNLRASSGGNVAVLSRLDTLEREIRTLTARVEELGYRMERIADDARLRFDDVEFRLTEVEGGDLGALQPSQPLGGNPAGAAVAGTAEASQTTGGGSQTAAVSISERGELDRAVEDVRQGRYDQAEERLQSFLSSYGDSPLKAEALYWLGETQLTRGDYPAAARSFLTGYNADLRGPRAPETLMKLGVSLGRLGQFQDACLTLKEVGTQFPSANARILQQAAEEADQLACG